VRMADFSCHWKKPVELIPLLTFYLLTDPYDTDTNGGKKISWIEWNKIQTTKA
jgi:hypothetical protein